MTDRENIIERFLWDNYPHAHNYDDGSHRKDAQQLAVLLKGANDD